MRLDTYFKVPYYQWEAHLANRFLDRKLTRHEEKAARALAELLYLLNATDILVEYDDYA